LAWIEAQSRVGTIQRPTAEATARAVCGVRTAADLRHEYQLAAMNEQLGIQTVWLPSRPQLAATLSTVARAYRWAQSARPSLNADEGRSGTATVATPRGGMHSSRQIRVLARCQRAVVSFYGE